MSGVYNVALGFGFGALGRQEEKCGRLKTRLLVSAITRRSFAVTSSVCSTT